MVYVSNVIENGKDKIEDVKNQVEAATTERLGMSRVHLLQNYNINLAKNRIPILCIMNYFVFRSQRCQYVREAITVQTIWSTYLWIGIVQDHSFDFVIIMWQTKGSQIPTANLCNEFLVVYISGKKKQFERIGMDRKALVYQTALNSIKKYPLPIICLKQLKSLYGIGEHLCQQLLAIVKQHYCQFLKQPPSTHPNTQFEPRNQENSQPDNYQSITFSRSTSQSLFKRAKSQQQCSQGEEEDTKSNYSFKSATINKPYRPRPRSQGANILTILSQHSNQYLNKQTISQRMKAEYSKVIPKNLILILGNLAKSGYIEQSSEDFTMIKISQKGMKEVEHLRAKSREKDSQIKVKSLINSFMAEKEQKFVPEVPQKREKEVVKQKAGAQLYLLIDNREVKDKQEQTFFEKKIEERWGIKTKTFNLPIGDFMWEYDGKIVDYVVQRKKADDLMSSIFDGRYKEQKFRLKNSGFSNIFYLFEGHLTGSYAKNQRQIQSALLNTRVREGFKVIEVNNITESLKFLHSLTESIHKKLESQTSLAILGSLEQVTVMNARSHQLTVSNIFGLSLKTIPGVGRGGVTEILKHFDTFRELYEKLREMNCRFQRVQFLRGLWKGGGVRGNVAELLVDVLFGVEK